MTIYPELSWIPWYLAELKEGDCLYIPFMWIHNVHNYKPQDNLILRYCVHSLTPTTGKGKDTVIASDTVTVYIYVYIYVTHFEEKGYHSDSVMTTR